MKTIYKNDTLFLSIDVREEWGYEPTSYLWAEIHRSRKNGIPFKWSDWIDLTPEGKALTDKWEKENASGISE